jgi:hypothetical protein
MDRGLRASVSINVPNSQRERDWLVSDDQHPGSFRWVCDVVGCDPDATRQALLRPRPSVARGGSSARGQDERGKDGEGDQEGEG